MSLLRNLVLAGFALPLTAGFVKAQDVRLAPGEDVFVLGTIVLESLNAGAPQGGSTAFVDAEEIKRENRATLDEALRTTPGVSLGNTGGSRNERLLTVRGFDRFQVPLSVDGIRVYLPADNRLDFGRFLTPDLAGIEVQKGYVSVLNGSGGMGGAINLVTRRPVAPLEAEARAGVEFGNTGKLANWTGMLSFGSRQEKFYVQGSYLQRDNDGFFLSRSYEPRLQQGAGRRLNSETEDDRWNLKFGFTPNATDEYVLSYTRQSGAKEAPYNVDQPIRSVTAGPGPGQSWQRDWTWPQWDLSSLAFYSHTDLAGGAGYVKTKAYLNSFDNILRAYDDSTHSAQTQGRAFDSIYDDRAWGLSLEGGYDLTERNTLRAAAHYRNDRHEATQHPRPSVNAALDPTETSEEETWSLALENTWRATDEISLVGGLSYERASVLRADETATSAGDPIGSSDAVNWQLAAVYEPEALPGRYHASVSSRTRFPTLFNRYSTRFGRGQPNPDLESERALNFELGWRGDLGPVQLEAAAFHSRIDDMIQSVPVGVNAANETVTQSQNVGDGVYQGVEIGARWDLNDAFALRGNATFLDREISEPVRPGLKPTDAPKFSGSLALDWRASDRLTVSPSVEFAGSRLSESAVQPSDPTQIAYTRNGGYALVNLNLAWQATDNAEIVVGARNLFDKNYEFVEGFPEPGASFYVTTSLKF